MILSFSVALHFRINDLCVQYWCHYLGKVIDHKRLAGLYLDSPLCCCCGDYGDCGGGVRMLMPVVGWPLLPP